METIDRFKDSPLGLFDNNSSEQSSVVADKVLDVTAMCPKSAQCVIKYATVTRGRLAQICHWYTKGIDLGGLIHYHLNEMTPESLAADVVFEGRARVMGANALQLSQIIFDNQ
jgi:hypothetical protein